MIRKIKIVLMSCCLGLISLPGHAEGIGYAAKLGTLGMGLEVGTALGDYPMIGRLGLYGYNYSSDFSSGDVSYDSEVELNSLALLVDWFTFPNDMRITFGYIKTIGDFDLEATPGKSTQIGDTTYTSSEIGRLTASLEQEGTLYLGAGWGVILNEGFSLSVDVGGLWMKEASVELASSGSVSDADLAKEERRLGEDFDSSNRFFPVIMIGASLGF